MSEAVINLYLIRAQFSLHTLLLDQTQILNVRGQGTPNIHQYGM
jgi:hypothetical protein